MGFYNTINEEGDTLKEYKSSAKHQESQVYYFFYIHKTDFYTPYMVWKEMGEPFGLNEVRRAITDLTEDGFLDKSPFKKMGGFGKMNYMWTCKAK